MLYLSENETGFDSEGIGFPSIDGCLAVVYLTQNGLFGYHSYGGATPSAWLPRASAFRDFVTQHQFGRSAGCRLYGAAFLNRRGYNPPSPRVWGNELKAFAAALRFRGKIRGYDLAQSGVQPPAYVVFDKMGAKCWGSAIPWADVIHTMATNTDLINRARVRVRANDVELLNQTANVVVGARATGNYTHLRSTRLTIL
jgi:hypothetical protein